MGMAWFTIMLCGQADNFWVMCLSNLHFKCLSKLQVQWIVTSSNVKQDESLKQTPNDALGINPDSLVPQTP